MIICLEGIDACGKNTHAKLLSKKLVEVRQRPSHTFSFPKYDSPSGEIILSHLKEKWRAGFAPGAELKEVVGDIMSMRHRDSDDDEAHILNAMVFQTLQTVNRMEQAESIVTASKTSNVILDRYWPSGWVYGVADGLDRGWLTRIHKFLPQADLYILLEVDPSVSSERRPERRDRYEKQQGLMEKVATLYRELWDYERVISPTQWKILDGEGSVEEVHTRIMRCVDGMR